MFGEQLAARLPRAANVIPIVRLAKIHVLRGGEVMRQCTIGAEMLTIRIITICPEPKRNLPIK